MGKVWHYCVVVMDICFFSGLASLGYTGGGDVYVNDSGACGRRTDFVIEYLVCSGILYAALQFFLIPGSSCHFWMYFQFCLFILSFPGIGGCVTLYLVIFGG